MEIAILTQDNKFLINKYVRLLAEGLTSSGSNVVIFRCSATAKGKKMSKLAGLRDLVSMFGPGFAMRAIGDAIVSSFRDRRASFPKKCKIVDVPDNQKVDASLFRAHCSEFNVLLILAGTRIIRKDVLDLWDHGVLNVHSSILPYARGVMPALWTYRDNKAMGVTLFRLDEGIDTGAIIQQIPVTSRPESYYRYLHETKVLGANMLIGWVQQNLVSLRSPPDVEDTYYSYPKPGFKLK